MGIMDSFDTDTTVKPTVTVSFDPEDSKRVIDASLAMKKKGCKNRGEFCRNAIMEAVIEVEKAFGGKNKVTEAAIKHDPDGTRYDKRVREKSGNGENVTPNPATAPATPKGKPAPSRSGSAKA